MNTTNITDNDVAAAYFAARYADMDAALDFAPDAECRDLARQHYQRGSVVLERYDVHASQIFPSGADPYGARLNEFMEKHKIVVWAEMSAGYVATSERRYYIGLSERD